MFEAVMLILLVFGSLGRTLDMTSIDFCWMFISGFWGFFLSTKTVLGSGLILKPVDMRSSSMIIFCEFDGFMFWFILEAKIEKGC